MNFSEQMIQISGFNAATAAMPWRTGRPVKAPSEQTQLQFGPEVAPEENGYLRELPCLRDCPPVGYSRSEYFLRESEGEQMSDEPLIAAYSRLFHRHRVSVDELLATPKYREAFLTEARLAMGAVPERDLLMRLLTLRKRSKLPRATDLTVTDDEA